VGIELTWIVFPVLSFAEIRWILELIEEGIPRVSEDTGEAALTRIESFTNVVPQSFVLTVLATCTVQVLAEHGEVAPAGSVS